MWRRIRSSLFIDYENMPLGPEAIANWLSWLEDGQFDQHKRRRLMLKRVYWNAAAQKHAQAYAAHGFEVVQCERYHGLTNSVDVRMAIDIVEAAIDRPRIEEFILITRDSDFVPVLQRLEHKKKRTVFLVNEAKFNIHTTYRQHADVLIAIRELKEAKTYVRPKPAWFGRRSEAKPTASPAGKSGTAPARAEPAKPAPTVAPTIDPMQRALDCVIRVTSSNPNKLTARAKVLKALKSVSGFALSGKNTYLGFGSYKALMAELARRDARIEVVDQQDGGIAVRYAPKLVV